ncbi:hypothetical protein [Methylocystis parvus]|uniref:hypothetical protein n=1 Tax=Methylocystis parvus TaxID=134 RepID=UPI003CC5F757
MSRGVTLSDGQIERGESGCFFEAIRESEAVEFPQKSLFGAGQHAFQSTARQKRAVAALRAETFDKRLVVEASNNVADANVSRIAREPDAALRAANAFEISGRGQFLQNFRHMVSRHAEMIGDRRRAHDFGVMVGKEDQRPQAEVCEGRQPHGENLTRYS